MAEQQITTPKVDCSRVDLGIKKGPNGCYYVPITFNSKDKEEINFIKNIDLNKISLGEKEDHTRLTIKLPDRQTLPPLPFVTERTKLPNGNVRMKMKLSGSDVILKPNTEYKLTFRFTGNEAPYIIKADEV